MSQKCIRSINWDEEEKQLFRSVLKEFASIIENKSLDTNTNKVKNKAWEELHKKWSGGARPPSPTDAVIEIKDLLNPAELLRDQNIYASNGIVESGKDRADEGAQAGDDIHRQPVRPPGISAHPSSSNFFNRGSFKKRKDYNDCKQHDKPT